MGIIWVTLWYYSMKVLIGMLLGMELFMITSPALSSEQLQFLMGWDGQFLGYLGDGTNICLEQDPNCIWSDTGPYGSPLSQTSIWNPYTTYHQATCGYILDYDPVAIMVTYDNSFESVEFYDFIWRYSASPEGQIIYSALCDS